MNEHEQSEAFERATRFARRIPTHLRDDAVLQSAVGQLVRGGVFSPKTMVWLDNYIRTTKRPATAEEFARAMQKALGQ